VNLAERRVATEFESNTYPALKARIEEAAGFPVPIEVKWDTLAAPGESHLWAEGWPQVYFEPLIECLNQVCRDDLGREAIRAKLHKIVVQNTKGCIYGDCWASFHDDVLTLDHESVTNIADSEQRKAGLIAVLESAL
jgi:hypothetical protein